MAPARRRSRRPGGSRAACRAGSRRSAGSDRTGRAARRARDRDPPRAAIRRSVGRSSAGGAGSSSVRRSNSARWSATWASRSAGHAVARAAAICRTTIGPGSRPSRAGSLSKPLNAVAVASSSVAASAPSTRMPAALVETVPPSATTPTAISNRMPGSVRRPLDGCGFSPAAHWPPGTPLSRPVLHRHVGLVVARLDVRRRHAAQADHAVLHSDRVPQGAGDARVEADEPGPVGGDPYGDDAGWMAGDHLACVADVADAIPDRRHRVAEPQLAPVVASEVAVLEREPEIAERQVGLREGAHQAVRGLVGGRVVAGQREAPHFGEGGLGTRCVPAARPARPQRVVVDLQPLDPDVAEDHGAEASVADRQRLDPLRRGASVP